MFYRWLPTAVLGALLAGCAAVVPLENDEVAQQLKTFAPPAAGQAAIYVYRDGHIGFALRKDVWIDNECLGSSAKGVFWRKEVEGNQEHDIATASEFSPNHLKLFTAADQTYFVRQYIKLGVFVGGANLEVVDEAQGKEAIAALSPAVAGQCQLPTPDARPDTAKEKSD